MDTPSQHVFEFGPFRIDAGERTLARDGRPVPVTPKAFDVLLVLVEQAGRVVEKEQLMAAVWPDAFVEDGNLTTSIYTLRKTLGSDAPFIETVPRRGYRFLCAVRRVAHDDGDLFVEERMTTDMVVEEIDEAVDASPQGAASAPGSRRSPRGAIAVAAGFVLAAVAFGVALWPRSAGPKAASAASGARSIAVLPFKAIGAEASDEYLGLGMADAVITRLGSIRQLLVRPTSAVRMFESQEKDAIAAGKELGVDLVLDGSVQKAGDRVHVSVQLVDVRDGATVWAQSFDERFTEIFAVQQSISEQVAESLAIKMTADEQRRLRGPRAYDPEAYRLYLMGRHFWNNGPIEQPLHYFQEAIDRDPTFALAHDGLADTYGLMGAWDGMAPREAFPKAEAECRKALELDDSLGEAHSSLAAIDLFYEWDPKAAERESLRAIELNPSYAEAYNIYAYSLMYMGRFDEAIAARQRMLDLDPSAENGRWNIARTYYFWRKYDDALTAYREYQRAYPKSTELVIGRILAQNGRDADAIAEWRAAFVTDGDEELVRIVDRTRSTSNFSAVVRAVAKKQLERLSTEAARRSVAAPRFARLYIDLGDKDRAFEWLEKGIQERSRWMLELPLDPTYDPIRSDPRFAEMVRRVRDTAGRPDAL